MVTTNAKEAAQTMNITPEEFRTECRESLYGCDCLTCQLFPAELAR